MTAIHETAYPRIRSNLSDKSDIAFVRQVTQAPVTELGLLVLLKAFQRLGYFPSFDALPPRLTDHIAKAIGIENPDDILSQYESRGYRWRHLPLIRDHFGIKTFGSGGRRAQRAPAVSAMIEASQSKDILAEELRLSPTPRDDPSN